MRPRDLGSCMHLVALAVQRPAQSSEGSSVDVRRSDSSENLDQKSKLLDIAQYLLNNLIKNPQGESGPQRTTKYSIA